MHDSCRVEIVTEGDRKRQIPKKLRNKIFEKYNWKCVYCDSDLRSPIWDGKSARYVDPMPSIDHILPWIADGVNTEDNLAPSCIICNSIKGSVRYKNITEARNFILERRRKRDAYQEPELLPSL